MCLALQLEKLSSGGKLNQPVRKKTVGSGFPTSKRLHIRHINDILIAFLTLEVHQEHIRIVFQRLKEFSLRIYPRNCQFGKSELEFLGYMINQEGCSPTPENLRAISEFPWPKNVNLHTGSFVGYCTVSSAKFLHRNRQSYL